MSQPPAIAAPRPRTQQLGAGNRRRTAPRMPSANVPSPMSYPIRTDQTNTQYELEEPWESPRTSSARSPRQSTEQAPAREEAKTAATTGYSSKLKPPTCALCNSLLVNENGFVKFSGTCKCISCQQCFCEIAALSFKCPLRHDGPGESLFSFDTLASIKRIVARDMLLSHEFEGTIADDAAQEIITKTFSQMKALYETNRNSTTEEVFREQLKIDLGQAIKAQASPQQLSEFGIVNLRLLALSLTQWLKLGYSITDLCQMGFAEQDFRKWDSPNDPLCEEELDELSLNGITLLEV